MAFLSPVSILAVPFLFVVTVPLAIFAGITTTLAFAILLFRVTLVYIDLALSLIPRSLAGQTSHHQRQMKALPSERSPSPTLLSTRRHRRRRSSASGLSGGSITPIADRGFGLIPSVGAERDYEGVGGWRLGDDEVWTTVSGRHHARVPSGGPSTGGESGYLMMKGRTRSPETRMRPAMSPNSSRARTPTGTRTTGKAAPQPDGYFPLMPASSKTTK